MRKVITSKTGGLNSKLWLSDKAFGISGTYIRDSAFPDALIIMTYGQLNFLDYELARKRKTETFPLFSCYVINLTDCFIFVSYDSEGLIYNSTLCI